MSARIDHAAAEAVSARLLDESDPACAGPRAGIYPLLTRTVHDGSRR